MTINELTKYATNNGIDILDAKELLKYEDILKFTSVYEEYVGCRRCKDTGDSFAG